MPEDSPNPAFLGRRVRLCLASLPRMSWSLFPLSPSKDPAIERFSSIFNHKSFHITEPFRHSLGLSWLTLFVLYFNPQNSIGQRVLTNPNFFRLSPKFPSTNWRRARHLQEGKDMKIHIPSMKLQCEIQTLFDRHFFRVFFGWFRMEHIQFLVKLK